MVKLKTNVLYYGDNLDILRHHIPEESIDLIYLDPPFNSQRSYNVLFRESSGVGSGAQMEAFEDTWHWGAVAQAAYEEVVTRAHQRVARLLQAMVEGLKHNDVTAYLTMMAIRLVELHRVLKPTGSIYLHCDPTAAHYLKVVMDAIFGVQNFRNEIAWKRFNFHADAKRFGRVSDRLLFYTKSEAYTWNRLRVGFKDSYIESHFTHFDENGRRYRLDNLNPPGGRGPVYEFHGQTRAWRFTRDKMLSLEADGKIYVAPGGVAQLKRYLDEQPGEAVHEMWTDIPPVNPQAKERLGYPTQKPLALLERIVSASSNPGDVVLDPFCGCGTAVHAAQKLGRQWIGIDITHLAIGLIRRRMQDVFQGLTIEVVGEPKDLAGAEYLAASKPTQFEYWVVDKLDAQPTGGKGPDLDGVMPFVEFGGKVKRAVISVKGTKSVNPEMIREVLGALGPDKPIGILVTLTKPTKGMITQAVAARSYESDGIKYQRVQTMTVEDILKGKRPHVPPPVSPFAKAPAEKKKGKQQPLL